MRHDRKGPPPLRTLALCIDQLCGPGPLALSLELFLCAQRTCQVVLYEGQGDGWCAGSPGKPRALYQVSGYVSYCPCSLSRGPILFLPASQ